MNFYDFCYNYLLKQTIEQAKLEEGDLQKYFECNLYSWEPYFTATRGKETKKDLMKMFAFILQNRFRLPSIINFCDNYENLKKILNEFDDEYIRQNNKKIHDELFKLSNNKHQKSWKQYEQGLIDSANLLKNYNNFKDFYDNSNIEELTRITGIGKVMARNFLKEIGKTEYGKPDIHLKSVFEIIENKPLNEQEFDEAIKKQALECGVSVYNLDRIVWLICSGKYFKDCSGKYFKDSTCLKNPNGILRKNFEEYLKNNINKIL